MGEVMVACVHVKPGGYRRISVTISSPKYSEVVEARDKYLAMWPPEGYSTSFGPIRRTPQGKVCEGSRFESAD